MWESRAGCDPNEEEVELAQEFGAASALLPLWQQGALVDVELEAADGVSATWLPARPTCPPACQCSQITRAAVQRGAAAPAVGCAGPQRAAAARTDNRVCARCPSGAAQAVLRAHRVVLAAASGFFRALLAGAGTGMREGLARSRCGAGGGGRGVVLAACGPAAAAQPRGHAPATSPLAPALQLVFHALCIAVG